MLITHSRECINYATGRVVSIFWSNNLLCQVRRNTNASAWFIDIRLWGSHPWLPHEQKLEQQSRRWSIAAVPFRLLCDVDEVVIFDTWCVVRSPNPRVQVRDSCVKQPDLYWYQVAAPKRDKKHYRLAKTYMETLCCTLCDVMRYPP